MTRKRGSFRGIMCAAAVIILVIVSPAWSLPGDLDCSGLVTVEDVDAFVLALVNPADYGTAYPDCDITQADMNVDGAENGADILGFVATLMGCSPTEPPIATELAGNSLGEYPYFEFVRAFNEDATVEVAIDPSQFPDIVGQTGDIYIVEAKSPGGWFADPTLADVSVGGPQAETFGGTTIQDNTFTITGAYELNSAAFVEATGDYTGLGHAYDIVLDMNQNGVLDTGDYIDGFSRGAGLYMVHDMTQPGPLVTSVVTYSGGYLLGQRTVFPESIGSMGQLPLVVIAPSGLGPMLFWYDYLQQHLASYGYIVMCHEESVGLGAEGSARKTIENTDYLLDHQDTIADGVLDGQIDSGRIVWIGHSQGGEGVVRACTRLRSGTYTAEHFSIDDIALVSSIAPTAFGSPADSNPFDIPYALWGLSGDAYVTGVPSFAASRLYRLHDRATGFRHTFTLQGVGHTDIWDCDPCGSDFSGPCHVGRETAHLILKAYHLALVKYYVAGNIPASDFFWRQHERFKPIGIPDGNYCSASGGDSVVVTKTYRNGADFGNFTIDNFEYNEEGTGHVDPLISSSGTAVTYTVTNLHEGRLSDGNATFTWMVNDPMNGMIYATEEDDAFGLVFDWNGEDLYYEQETVSGHRDFTDYIYLSFRACQGTRHPYTIAKLQDLTFSVTLRDGGGTTNSINIGAYGGGIEEPYQRSEAGEGVGWFNEMETIRIRLTDFLANGSGLDLTDIVAVRFNVGPSWGSNGGRIVVDELMLTNDYPCYFIPLTIILPIEPSEFIPPGVPTSIDVEIFEGNDALLAGSTLLHYRYDGGSWQSAEMEQIAGELWRGTLPAASCDDAPEYYFSAIGSVTGVVYSPSGGASTPYVSFVGNLISIMDDDFETDQGWTVWDDPSLTGGAWERGVPIGGGDRQDPADDYDGSGQCFLTENVDGNSDVDGGPTRLMSPVFDLSTTANPVLRYARYWANDDQDGDPMDVEISNNAGGSWVLVETVTNVGNEWFERAVYITDYIAVLTDPMQVRFSVRDVPSNSIDEGGIDAFEVFEVECSE